MLHEEKAFSITCDGCGTEFRSVEDRANLFGHGTDMLPELELAQWETLDEVATGKVLHFCRHCKGENKSQQS